MPDHTEQCASAWQAWISAWQRAPVNHVILRERFLKAASKCPCKGAGIADTIKIDEIRLREAK